jgi:hypothetical protein
MEVLVVLIIIALLIGIFSRSSRTGNVWFTRQCPHCGQRIPMKVTRCAWCTGEVEPVRWRWETNEPSRG